MPFDALPIDYSHEVTPVTSHCVEQVIDHFDLHRDLIFVILLIEGGTVGVENCHNEDGSCDLGPAQINEVHLAELKPYGITREMVTNNGCVNIAVAGWHLSERIKGQTVNNTQDYLRVIARYHSKTPEFNKIYQQRLKEAFALLYRDS